MKTIVIPDVHQRINQVQTILDKEKDYDEIVFLGDWFDSFLEPPQVAGFEETCIFLRNLVLEHSNKDKFVFLLGNHDISYIFENKDLSCHKISKTLHYFCSGFTASKAKKFRHQFFDRGLKDDFFTKHFKVAHQSQGWTFSHAGIMPDHFPYGYTLERLVDELLPDIWRNFRNLGYRHNWLLSGAGLARGGWEKVGGITWCDWNKEFYATSMIGKQVLGHTTVKEPTVESQGTEFESWNLDCEEYYGIILDGKFRFKLVNPIETPCEKTSTLTNAQTVP
jgi:hypothetical protein